ncbi:MAG: hypothetical protein ACR2KL_04175 [Nocardioidaceae bacterium]
MFVLTIDQRESRKQADHVPRVLAELAAAIAPALPFERTAGDEVQGVLTAPDDVVGVALRLQRGGGWWVGVGIGAVETPLPASAREGRGEAYRNARTAVESAKSNSSGLAVVGGPLATHVEAALWLLATLLHRRTPPGWQVVDAMRGRRLQIDVARELGISAQAVSRRLQVAGWTEERRGRELAAWLLAQADGEPA